VPPRLKVGGLLAGLVLGRALAKSGPPPGLREDATAGCEEAGCASGVAVAALLAGAVPERALAKSEPPDCLEEDAAAGCEQAGCAAAIDPHMLGKGVLLAGVAPEKALAKSGPPAGLEEDTADGCEEAGCAADTAGCAAGVIAGVVPEGALAKSSPPAGLREDTADRCKEAGCAAGVCPPRPKVGCLFADVMVGRAFAEKSPPVAGLEESAAVLGGSPNKDDGPPKKLGFGTAVEAVVVGVALVNGEAFEKEAFHAFPCSNMDFDLLAYTVEGPEGGTIDVLK
jgi:hypothetical protein